MKSLFKIIRSYMTSALLLVLVFAVINLISVAVIAVSYAERSDERTQGSNYLTLTAELEAMSAEFLTSDGSAELSPDGMEILEQSGFSWAMLLNEGGDVIWSWQLPHDFAMSYSLVDVSQFSRWYLNDYPVRVWEAGEDLLVVGYDKDKYFRQSLVYDKDYFSVLGTLVTAAVAVNLSLILILTLWFSYRFYRSLRPLAQGIGLLAENRPVCLSERGITSELAKKINRTSRLLELQSKKLSQRDNARTEWIAGVSHDIRTPLSLITGYSESLAADPEMTAENRQSAEIIRKQCLIIRQLISDLNLTSKLEYNAQPLHIEEYSPAVLLRETAADYYNEGLDDAYEIQLNVDPEAEKVHLQGDKGLLKRALRNIIGNSIRHNPEGCLITIRLFTDEENVVWRFSDSGPGIPARVVDILEGRSDDSLHIMGLRIAMQIVAAHGGNVSFPRDKSGAYGAAFLMPASDPPEGSGS